MCRVHDRRITNSRALIPVVRGRSRRGVRALVRIEASVRSDQSARVPPLTVHPGPVIAKVDRQGVRARRQIAANAHSDRSAPGLRPIVRFVVIGKVDHLDVRVRLPIAGNVRSDQSVPVRLDLALKRNSDRRESSGHPAKTVHVKIIRREVLSAIADIDYLFRVNRAHPLLEDGVRAS